MFTIINHTITEKDIEKFLLVPRVNRILKKSGLSENEVSTTLHTLAEKTDWVIDTILKETIMDIGDKSLRNEFRRQLLSKKFGIQPRKRGVINEYAIVYSSDECVLVHSPHDIRSQGYIIETSTIILSPIGEIKVSEGEVYIRVESLSWHGFYAWKSEFMGIYTSKGNVLFPCVFDHLSNPIDWSGDLIYKGFKYHYTLIGNVSNTDIEKISLISPSIIFVCENKVYLIKYRGYNEDGYIHRGGYSFSRPNGERDPFLGLPSEDRMRLAKQSIKELFEIIKSIHPNNTINYDENNRINVFGG